MVSQGSKTGRALALLAPNSLTSISELGRRMQYTVEIGQDTTGGRRELWSLEPQFLSWDISVCMQQWLILFYRVSQRQSSPK